MSTTETTAAPLDGQQVIIRYGNIVYLLRVIYHGSQGDLSRESRVERSRISRIESGEIEPTDDELLRLFKGLAVLGQRKSQGNGGSNGNGRAPRNGGNGAKGPARAMTKG